MDWDSVFMRDGIWDLDLMGLDSGYTFRDCDSIFKLKIRKKSNIGYEYRIYGSVYTYGIWY